MTDTPETPDVPSAPPSGGSWLRDPQTGALTRLDEAAAPPPPVQPTPAHEEDGA